MTDDRSTRRDLLRAAAGLGTTAALGSLAGCTGPRVDRRVGDGGDGPGYRRWLPGRGTLGVEPGTQYGFITVDVAAALAGEERFSSATATALRGIFEGELLPGADDVDLLVSVQAGAGSGTVAIEGSFRAEELAEALLADEYDRETSYAGYEVLANDRGGVVGLADGTLVASGGDDAVDGLRSAIDASDGDAELITDESDDAAELVSELGRGLFANGGLPAGGVAPALRSDALAANGLRGRLSGGTTEVRQVLVYDDAGDVDAAAVEGASGTAAALDGAGVRRSGRTALVEGSIPTDALRPEDLFGVAIRRETGEDGGRARVGGSSPIDPVTSPSLSARLEFDRTA